MGVSQLLKELKPCLVNSHVENYSGKTVVIDGNAFIFRGAYSCSEEVCGYSVFCFFSEDPRTFNVVNMKLTRDTSETESSNNQYFASGRLGCCGRIHVSLK